MEDCRWQINFVAAFGGADGRLQMEDGRWKISDDRLQIVVD
jgi:hypothetical protein